MRKFNLTILFLLILLASPSAPAQLHMPEIFTDNMVLQCDRNVNVWGNAAPDALVGVSFGKQRVSTTADSEGKWQLQLRPMEASATPRDMTISSGKQRITLRNILVGEVWLAGGQSNMEYSMGKLWLNGGGKRMAPKHSPNIQQLELDRIAAADSIAAGSATPLVRILHVHKELKTDTLPTAGWEVVNREDIDKFSACAYFFAKDLSDSLRRPVGIISSAWGGTPIEDWKDDKAARFNKMIKPMMPYTIRGIIWYQGETNLTHSQYEQYYNMMKTLIDNWRQGFGQGRELPFYFVQLAPYYYTRRRIDAVALSWESLPRFRVWQDKVVSDVPGTGRIVITDLVDDGEIGDIHPTFKWEVGRRLADMALHDTYGRTDIIANSPEVKTWYSDGDKIIVEFDCFGSKLTTRDGAAPKYFEVMDRQGRWRTATAQLDGNRVILTAPKYPGKLSNFRFVWDESYQPNLCNTQGLPANGYNSTFKP